MKNKNILQLFFIIVLVVMAYGSVIATLDRGIITAIKELWPDPWFQVTIYDTYFAFLTFYIWVFYKEKKLSLRCLWLVLILLLGNFAMAIYTLIQLSQLKANEPTHHVLLRKEDL